MAAVILPFVQIFRDFGLTNAVLRTATIDQSELSMIFLFDVAMTTRLSSLLAVLAPVVSGFYEKLVVF